MANTEARATPPICTGPVGGISVLSSSKPVTGSGGPVEMAGRHQSKPPMPVDPKRAPIFKPLKCHSWKDSLFLLLLLLIITWNALLARHSAPVAANSGLVEIRIRRRTLSDDQGAAAAFKPYLTSARDFRVESCSGREVDLQWKPRKSYLRECRIGQGPRTWKLTMG